MSDAMPEICAPPLIQADTLSQYIARRLSAGNLDLYSAFLLAHEATRIRRYGYLQPAWRYQLSISGLLRIYMLGVTATAFQIEGVVSVARHWLMNDIALLVEKRPHFFTDRIGKIELFTDIPFLTTLSDMRDQYASLPDDEGPYHVEVFPWDDASPERELIRPNSQPAFNNTRNIDPEVETLLVELATSQWA